MAISLIPTYMYGTAVRLEENLVLQLASDS